MQNDISQAQRAVQGGDFRTAQRLARKGLKADKTHPGWMNIAGIAECGLGRHKAGLPHFQLALKLAPDFHDARRNLAQTLVLLGRTDEADMHLRQLTDANPQDAGAWALLAQVGMARGDDVAAKAAVDSVIALYPGQARGYLLRARLLGQTGDEMGALADLERAAELEPGNVEALIALSLPLARADRPDTARTVAERAAALAPGHVPARLALAMRLVEQGQTEAAKEQYRAVLEITPGQPEALEQLAQINSGAENAALIPQALAALKAADDSGPAKGQLHFALARIAAQAGDEDGFTKHLTRANAAMARLMPYDAGADTRLSEALMARFGPGADRDGSGDGVAPVYVLGLPRSGTSLTEAMLGAHPAVHPLGERIAPGRLLAPLINGNLPFDEQARATFRKGEAESLPALPDGTRFYTDKMPENYRLVGFLLTARADARVIHLRRDPRDVALSLWQAHLAGSALNYAYDLRAMAHRFNLYARMMAHWHAEFPGRILDLAYEDLVADVEGASHRLAAHLGLDWVPEMARPDQAAGQVLTLSANQLRQPVHTRSVGKWRKHEAMLAPFIAGLDPGLWPELGQARV
ncbi:sulfotransferase [Ruegeria pomeroyi]|nr:sulfotransferase [Ruegeria pomeroyi]